MGMQGLGYKEVKIHIDDHHQRGLAMKSMVPGLHAETPKMGEESKVGPSLEAMEFESSNLGQGSIPDTRAHAHHGRLGLANQTKNSFERGHKVKVTLTLNSLSEF